MTSSISISPTTRSVLHQWCTKHHYSQTGRGSASICYELYEDADPVGCIGFGLGATPNIHKPFGAKQGTVYECVRVACKQHETPTGQFLRCCIRDIKKTRPDIDIIVSFSDLEQGHTGVLYQASGWTLIGHTKGRAIEIGGVRYHPKTLHRKYGIGGQSIPWLKENVCKSARLVELLPKLKYATGLTAWGRRQVARCGQSVKGDTLRLQRKESGSIPEDRFAYKTSGVLV